MNFARELDARGLNCPLPILRTKKFLAEMNSGEILKILTTDPGSVRDFNAFAGMTKNEIIDSGSCGHEFYFYLKKK